MIEILKIHLLQSSPIVDNCSTDKMLQGLEINTRSHGRSKERRKPKDFQVSSPIDTH